MVDASVSTSRLSAHARDQSPRSEDVHRALQVVSQDVQAHLGPNPWQSLGEEMGRPHPTLQCAEGMLGRLPGRSRGFRGAVKPTLHIIEHPLVFPARDASIWTRRALRLYRTARAG